MFVVGGINAVAPFMPAGIEVAVQGVLSVIATYFHVNPSQNYNQ